MSQHDYDIANQTFPNTRSDLNLALKALASTSSGTSAPSTTYANQLWYDSSANILYIRNEDNDANITIMALDQSNDTVEYFKSDSIRTALIEFTDGDDALSIADGGALTTASSLDVNGNELILDADADTSITADTDDRIDIKIANADDFRFTANSFNALSGSSIVVDSGATLTLNGTAGTGLVGKQTIYIPASAMYPNTTSGCADLAQVELTNGVEMKVLDFDASSDEHAQFSVCFPKLWNEGTVTFQPFWTVTGTNTGTVAWGLSAVAIADNGDINTAFGTNVVTTAKAHSGTSNDLDVSAESGAVSIAGSPSVDEMVFFQIMRDVSADDQSGDARLLGIKLFYTTDALNSA